MALYLARSQAPLCPSRAPRPPDQSPESRTPLGAHLLKSSQGLAVPWFQGAPPSGWSLSSQGPDAQPCNSLSQIPPRPPTSNHLSHPEPPHVESTLFMCTNPLCTPVSHFAYGATEAQRVSNLVKATQPGSGTFGHLTIQSCSSGTSSYETRPPECPRALPTACSSQAPSRCLYSCVLPRPASPSVFTGSPPPLPRIQIPGVFFASLPDRAPDEFRGPGLGPGR